MKIATFEIPVLGKAIMIDDKSYNCFSFQNKLYKNDPRLKIEHIDFRTGNKYIALSSDGIKENNLSLKSVSVPIYEEGSFVYAESKETNKPTFGKIGKKSFLVYDYDLFSFNVKYSIVDLVHDEAIGFFNHSEIKVYDGEFGE